MSSASRTMKNPNAFPTIKYHGPNRPSRRAFLGGGSVAVALPFLESLVPRSARAQALTPPQRLVYWFVPNGINGSTVNAWKPVEVGSTYTTTPILMPLDALKADFQVVTGLENVLGKPDGPGDHAAGTSSTITCAHATKS